MATMRVAARPRLAPMKAAQISKPGAEFEIVECEIPEPGPVPHSFAYFANEWGASMDRAVDQNLFDCDPDAIRPDDF